MKLQCKETTEYIHDPHPEGIHPAVCVDCIDLGRVKAHFDGAEKMVNKLRLVFESDKKKDNGENHTVFKTFTASLHPKARLTEFLGQWRGKPIMPDEEIDTENLIGACCTLVVSHRQTVGKRTYADIDAISKPNVKLTPSGKYNPAAERQRIEEYKNKPRTTSAPTMAKPATPTANTADSIADDDIPF